MKRRTIIIMLLAIIAAAIPSGIQAQGLGGLLKKGKQALEKVTKEEKKSDNAKEVVNAVTLSNGIEVSNPIAEFVEVEPVGLYGVPKSMNFGDAYLVLKVLTKVPVESACIGSSVKNQKMIAADASGKIYNIDSSGCMRYDIMEGIPVEIRMEEPEMMFLDVPKSLNVMPIVKIGINLDAYHQGNLTLKNVPIFWEETEEVTAD